MTLPPDDRSDAALLAASSRDPAAFRALYDRHADSIYAFARARVGDHHTALDITAETFARAWFARRRFRDRRGGRARPWLHGIAANVVREAARRNRLALDATNRLGVVLGVDREPAAPDASWVDGLDADLAAALTDLPEGQRRAVVGRVVEDASYDDLADDLDVTPTTARARVSRGLSHLRRHLEETADARP